jgi:predicted small secreted protein
MGARAASSDAPCALRGEAELKTGEKGMTTALKLMIGLLAILVLPSLSACNTARGMGEDVSAAGNAMSGTAEKTEEKIKEGTSQ